MNSKNIRSGGDSRKNPDDELRLAGKVAIVTGGGAAGDGIGNGRAAAILLARAGASVLVADKEEGLARRTVEMIETEGGTAVAHGVDVTDEAQCREMVRAVVERFGRLDLLDNNVGIGSRGSVVEEDPEIWRRVMQVNVESMFLTAKYAIPAMIASGDGTGDTSGRSGSIGECGAIVNVASIAAIRPRGLTAYTTSKGAVVSLTMAMAVDHGKDGIRVNCVAPGPVFTPMVSVGGMSNEARQRRKNASVLGIEGTGWDVGHAARFLLSGQARYITGQTLVVDGGVTLLSPAREHDGG
jgi:NAD(P)-dependent dehydrogenase (short-subunit alcohol dehydrogenase family)